MKTWLVPIEKREAAYDWIRKQKTQTFIVCPLIEQSDSETLLEVRAAKKEYERLNAPPTPFMQIVRREAIPLW